MGEGLMSGAKVSRRSEKLVWPLDKPLGPPLPATAARLSPPGQ